MQHLGIIYFEDFSSTSGKISKHLQDWLPYLHCLVYTFVLNWKSHKLMRYLLNEDTHVLHMCNSLSITGTILWLEQYTNNSHIVERESFHSHVLVICLSITYHRYIISQSAKSTLSFIIGVHSVFCHTVNY